MTRRTLRLWRLSAIVLPLCGCAIPSAEVKAPEAKLPEAYENGRSGPNGARLSWREYFADAPLNALIETALESNPDMHIALQRVEQARAVAQRATGAVLPRVALVAGASLRKFGSYTMDGAGNAVTDIRPGQRVPTHLPDFSVGLQSTWEVDVWGKLRSQRESAVARYLGSIEGTRFVTTRLVADVATAYFELVALDHELEVLGETEQRQQTALDMMRLQKEVGRANELAVQQFQAQLASTRALRVSAAQRARALENQLNLLLGRGPERVSRTEDGRLPEVGRGVSAGLPSELLKNRPDIRRAELEVQAARYDLEAARAAFFPSFTIAAGGGYQAFNPRFLLSTPESLTYSVLGGLVAPLVNRSGIEAAFSAAKAYQLEALYNYQKVVLTGFVEVASALSRLERASEALELRRAQREAMLGTVETADALYRAGKASYFEVLMAQQSSLAAELELIGAEKARRLASVALYRSLGGGWQ